MNQRARQVARQREVYLKTGASRVAALFGRPGASLGRIPKGAELDDRERWEGVILNVAEAWDAINAVSGGCDGAASHVAGRILWRGKNKGEPEGSGGDGQE